MYSIESLSPVEKLVRKNTNGNYKTCIVQKMLSSSNAYKFNYVREPLTITS